MSFNERSNNNKLNYLLNTCIREMRKFDCESEPTNDYGYNANLFMSLNLTPFENLHELVSNMVFEMDVINVADEKTAANVFLLMAALCDAGIIENEDDDSEDKFDENGIKYAKKEKICYPLMALLFSNECDYYMLGSRLIPRVLIGGEYELKEHFQKWVDEFEIEYPNNGDVDTFFDTLYVAWVPSPEDLTSQCTPYYNQRSDEYELKLRLLEDLDFSYQDIVKKGRGEYFKWIVNLSSLDFKIKVDPSLNLW